jgi:hypothetical protein
MPPKTITKVPKTPKTTAGAKSDALPVVNVDSITSCIQGVTVTKGVKKPAFTSYSTKVQDPILIRTVYVDGEQYVEFDLSCGDGINAVLASNGMGISLQRGVYASFFTNRRYRKDQDTKYSKDSISVTAHRKVCDKFKKKESARNGIVYGECQFVQLPCECTGLVEEIFTGRVQTPITIPYSITTIVDGMSLTETEDHIQFMVNKTFTFRVKTVAQEQKEKRKVIEVTHSGYDIYADYDSEGTL